MTDLFVIDFEVFYKDWGCCIRNPVSGEEYEFWNDREGLLKFYESHKDDLFIGYNILHYDQYIFKAVLLDMDPYPLSKFIVEEKQQGWKWSNAFRKIPLNFFDLKFRRDIGLKQLEGFMGLSIKESKVSFKLQRKLTEEELEMSKEYCMNDVRATCAVFYYSQSEFLSYIGLLKMFDFPLRDMCKTKAQLASKVLGANKPAKSRDDEWDFPIVDTIRLDKYQYIKDWYLNPENRNPKKFFKTEINGAKAKYGWGGMHSGSDACSKKASFLSVDVGSFYPAIMIEYGLLSRNVSTPEKFRELRDARIGYKKTDKGKADSIKIVLNAAFGASGRESNQLYDPRTMRAVCVNGQLLLTDLIEKLEPYSILHDGNTDGLLFEFEEKNREKIVEICKEWECRTRVSLDYKFYDEMHRKDVSCYILCNNGEAAKRIGGWVKKPKPLDNDVPIVREALVDYLVKGIRPEDTILACKDFIQFQSIVKVGDTFAYTEHNGNRHDERVFRVYASRDENDGPLYKVRADGSRVKIGNTSNRCFIWNESVLNEPCPEKLDLQYYIDLVYERAACFTEGEKK